tara:strand:+ start:550 stop:723 length:174 start_codon:yes stop_codon:yes gene_type:complete
MDFDSYVDECVEEFKRDNEEDLKEGGCFEDWNDDDIRLNVLENIKDQTKIELRSFEN